MKKHTPGPWTNVDGTICYGEMGQFAVCTTVGYESTEADADLIAAAPELLDSLKNITRILDAVRYQVGLGKNQLDRLEKAKSIIAKIEGNHG